MSGRTQVGKDVKTGWDVDTHVESCGSRPCFREAGSCLLQCKVEIVINTEIKTPLGSLLKNHDRKQVDAIGASRTSLHVPDTTNNDTHITIAART